MRDLKKVEVSLRYGGPVIEVKTGFDPQVHGFGFSNRFSGGAVLAELARQSKLDELTGLTVPRVVRQLTDLAAGEDFWGTFGLCGGMSWSALGRYRDGGPFDDTSTVPGPDTELFHELVATQADSMKGRTLLERTLIWQFLPDRAPWWMFWSRGVGRLTIEQEWPKLKTSLDADAPTSLVIIRASGGANPSANHQAVAVGYRVADNGQVEIGLYDPNHPRSRPTISIDPGSRSVGPRQSTSEPVRGFFVWSAT